MASYNNSNRIKSQEKSVLITLQKCSKLIKEQVTKVLTKNEIILSFDQWLLLSEIYNKQGMGQHELAELLGKEVASVSRILKKLEASKFIIKKVNLKNKKAYKIFLTPEGLELTEEVNKTCHKKMKEIFSKVYERELNIVGEVLARIMNYS